MDAALSISNGDYSSKQSTTSQEPELMDKDGVQPTIHPSLQLELKLPCSTETESGNIYRATSRCGLDVMTVKPSPSTSHSMIAERGSRGCHNDGEGDGGRGSKKLRLSKEQSCYLEECFEEHTTLNPKRKLAIAKRLNLLPRQVEVWFQNRRARTKLKQTEVDYKYLKQWRKYLTEENRRLHKEIQELKAFKSPLQNAHHYKQPTMLTMCPSCQHAIVPQKIHSFHATTDGENCPRLAC
ncbi:homeobox-leucine zipper protein HAT4-like isoform X2 [Phoenix dactylifera]|uniref:Homeobox-leucine zipper protein HAT4-like isoform X2 n=1 Tax=Phoenix dactylifera TaxID=42345 RepID=A0A8B8J7Q3_PHODC|nr:homeobox-leucine zipper protein HAT4-like isoform X2 [Phoenix dactylifera]